VCIHWPLCAGDSADYTVSVSLGCVCSIKQVVEFTPRLSKELLHSDCNMSVFCVRSSPSQIYPK
jgi:hypothetical protein